MTEAGKTANVDSSTTGGAGMVTGVEIEVMQTLLDIWRHRILVVAMTLLGTMLAGAVAVLATPVYRVSTVLLPVDDSTGMGGAMPGLGDLGALAAVAGLGNGMFADPSIEAEALLRSRKFTEDFIRDQNLLPKLFGGKWDRNKSAWRVAEDDVPTVADGFQVFDRKVRKLDRDRKTGLVTLSIDWRDPSVAAAWANELVRRVNEEMRARTLSDTSAQIEQLQQQLASTDVVPLQTSIAQLLEAQIKRQTFARVRSDFALRVIDPAVVPGEDEQVFPKRLLLLVVGFAAGLALGVFGAVVLGPVRRSIKVLAAA